MTEMERYLRHVLELIEREARAFPDEDRIGAGVMARNALAAVALRGAKNQKEVGGDG